MLSGDGVVGQEEETTTVGDGSVQTVVSVQATPEYVLTIETPVDEEGLAALPESPADGDDAEAPPVFVVSTEQTTSGPRAVLSLNPLYQENPPTAIQTLKLELQLGGQVLESYEILIDIAEERFRDAFLEERIERVEAELPPIDPATIASWRGETLRQQQGASYEGAFRPLTTEQETEYVQYLASSAPAETDSIVAEGDLLDIIAKRRFQSSTTRTRGEVGVTNAEIDSRLALYNDSVTLAEDLKTQRMAATRTEELEQVKVGEDSLRKAGLLLAKELSIDLKSEDPAIAAAATALRDELVAVSDTYHTLFTGLGIDREVERKVTSSGDTKAFSFIETGSYAFHDRLQIELPGQQAMVQVTQRNLLRTFPLISASESPAVEDGSTDEVSPSTNGASGTSLHVDGTTGATREALLRFNLAEIAALDNATPIADAKLKLSELVAGTGDTEVYVWNAILPGGSGSASDWDETNLTWNRVASTLDLDSNLSEFTQLDSWSAGTTSEIDVTDHLRRALLYGDANGDGEFGAAGLRGDIEAFHLAVTNWDAYVAEYGPRASSPEDLLARSDGGLGDGMVDENDIADFFRRHGFSQGDFNLDGTVQDNQDSTVDGLDWAIYQSNFGLTNARFGQGDGNFDGVVDSDDFDVWNNAKLEDNLTPVTPEVVFWLRPGDSTTDLEFASQEHLTLDGPTLEITEQSDIVLDRFTVEDTGIIVDYSVLGADFTGVEIELYKTGDPDSLLHTVTGLTGTIGPHSVTIATSVLSSIVEGDSLYAKVTGTPSSGTQSNTNNDQLDFEFSTAAEQVVNSLDDAGMDTLITSQHTLRELLLADEMLGWFDKVTFDEALFDDGAHRLTLGDHDGDNVADGLSVRDSLEIEGPGAHLLAISGNDQTRVMYFHWSLAATLSGLAIERGYSSSTGAGILNAADLTLNEVVVRNNASDDWGGGLSSTNGDLTIIASTFVGNTGQRGAGMYRHTSDKTTRIEASTFYDNVATAVTSVHRGNGGGAYFSGGSSQDVDILNSTFSGNEAVKGAGLTFYGTYPVDIVNSTITQNDAAVNGIAQSNLVTTGGVHIHDSGADVTLHNTIVAENTSSNIYRTNFSGNVTTDSSYNLVEDRVVGGHAGGLTDGVAGNIVLANGAYLGLAQLDHYGGATPTHLVHLDSPALDGGSDAMALAYSLTEDQMGFDRFADVVGVNDASGNAGNIGGYEAAPVVVEANGDKYTPRGYNLRQAISEARAAHAVSSNPQVITFHAENFDEFTTLALRDQNGDLKPDPLELDFDVSIVGPGADILFVDGQSTQVNPSYKSVFEISAGVNVSISGMQITGGDNSGIYSEGNLAVESVWIHGNNQTVYGGGIYQVGGNLTVDNSTVSNNVSGYGGGGIYAEHAGTVDITNSTISGNESYYQGGGITLENNSFTQIFTSTISHNTVHTEPYTEGAGLYILDSNGAVTIANTILAQNIGESDIRTSDPSNFFSSTHNLIGKDPSGSFPITAGDGNQVGVSEEISANLAPLGNYGGPTPTHALLAESAALDLGNPSFTTLPQYDQRGEGFPRTIEGLIDIGAYQANSNTADIVFIFDESGSMIEEQAWLKDGIVSAALTSELDLRGIQTPRYGLYRFGGGSAQFGESVMVGGGLFGTADELTVAAVEVLSAGSGGLEDGYDAIYDVLSQYQFRARSPVNIILLSDEDRAYHPTRDLTNDSDRANDLAFLRDKLQQDHNAILNVIVAADYKLGFPEDTPLGVINTGGDYVVETGSGGIAVVTGTPTPDVDSFNYGGVYNHAPEGVYTDYIQLAWQTGGATWDIGLLDDPVLKPAFTKAFAEIKAQEIASTDITLVEQDRFITKERFSIPAGADAIEIRYFDLSFDFLSGNPRDVNDAFEIAILDSNGAPATIGNPGYRTLDTINAVSDALLNITQGEQPALGQGVQLVENTPGDPTSGAVQVNLAGLRDDVTYEVVVRLVNVDADNATEVSLPANPVSVISAGAFGSSLLPASAQTTRESSSRVSFNQLSDVSPSFDYKFQHTTIDEIDAGDQADIARTRLALSKLPGQQVRRDLLIAVRPPTAQLRADGTPGDPGHTQLTDFDGLLPIEIAGLPAGTPFVRITGLMDSENEFYTTTDDNPLEHVELAFAHEKNERFDFDLVILGVLNDPPTFTSDPYATERGNAYPVDEDPSLGAASPRILEMVVEEGRNNTFIYRPDTLDPNDDRVRIEKIEGPTGASVVGDSDFPHTIEWSPSASDLGVYSFTLRAIDEHGAFDPLGDQVIQLRLVAESTNRPPRFTTPPVTLATYGQTYEYDADAFDPDGHDLQYFGIGAQSGLGATPQQFDIPLAELATGSFTADYLTFVNNTTSPGAVGMYSNIRLYEADSAAEPVPMRFDRSKFQQYGTTVSTGTLAVTGDASVVRLTGDGRQAYPLPIGYEVTAETRLAFTFSSETQGNAHGIGVDDATAAVTGNRWFQVHGQDALSTSNASADSPNSYDPAWLVDQSTNFSVDAMTGEVTWDTIPAEAIGQWVQVDLEVVEDEPHSLLLSDTQSYQLYVQPGDTPPLQVGQVDLTIDNIDLGPLNDNGVPEIFNQDGTSVAGVITADIHNIGSGTVNGPFSVLFFEDLDFDGTYTASRDRVLGRTTFEQPLASDDRAVTVAATVSGQVQYAGAIIHAFVDSGDVINEADETNNYAGSHDECLVHLPKDFALELEWDSDLISAFPTYTESRGTPAVIKLNPDDEFPAVVFIAFEEGGTEEAAGMLRAVNGANGNHLWHAFDPNPSAGIHFGANIAAGDIDGDSHPEFIVTSYTPNELLVFEHDGTFKSRSGPLPELEQLWTYWGGVSLANIDGVGEPEIIFGHTVFNADLTVRWVGEPATFIGSKGSETGNFNQGSQGAHGPLSIVADIDLDGSPEVIAGGSVFNADGSSKWVAFEENGFLRIYDGFTAVGDFDDDPNAEVVLVSSGYVYLLDDDGVILMSATLPTDELNINPGNKNGGPPTIADFDGDQQAEIGVATDLAYTVYEADGSLTWSAPVTIKDHSSGMTGSTVFDFDGDGQIEVVYRDEDKLLVLDGATGQLRLSLPVSVESGTGTELPLIADVDADGHAEIIVTSDGPGTNNGILVFGDDTQDGTEDWMPARGIWNQHSYHVTNVNDDGSIPIVEQPSWLTHNTYRTQVTPDGATPTGEPAPDLIPSFLREQDTPTGTTYTIRVGNAGSAAVDVPSTVKFLDSANGNALLAEATLDPLGIGEFADVSIDYNGTPVPLEDITVVVDADEEVAECREENNSYSMGTVQINTIPEIISEPIRSVLEEATYQYNVETDDPEQSEVGRTLVYDLPVKPSGMQIDPLTGKITWAPTLQQTIRGRHFVTVRVQDGVGGRDTQSFHIDVISDNLPPEIALPSNVDPFSDADPISAAEPGVTWNYNVSATDPNDDSLLYNLVVLDGLESAEAAPTIVEETGSITWDVPASWDTSSRDGVFFRVTVDDGRGGRDSELFYVPVFEPIADNTPPDLHFVDDLNSQLEVLAPVVLNELWEVRVYATDDQDTLDSRDASTSLVVSIDAAASARGMSYDQSTGVLSWTPTSDDPAFVTITATDSGGLTSSVPLELPVNVRAAPVGENEPAKLSETPTPAVYRDRPWFKLLKATDLENDQVTLTIASFMDADGTDLIPSLPPTQLTTTDGVNPTLLLNWTPDETVVSPVTLVVNADDGLGTNVGGGSDSTLTFSLPINENNRPFFRRAPAEVSIVYDPTAPQTVPLKLELVDYDQDDIVQLDLISSFSGSTELTTDEAGGNSVSNRFSASSDPETPTTLYLQFTPDEVGVQYLTLRATDKFRKSSTHTIVVDVVEVLDPTDPVGPFPEQDPIGPNTAPRITSTPQPAPNSGTYEYLVRAIDDQLHAITLNVDSTSMPSGIGFSDNGDGTGLFTWDSPAGSETFTFIATDEYNLSSEQTITLNAGDGAVDTAPTIGGDPPRRIAIDQEYSHQVLVTDPDAPGTGDITYEIDTDMPLSLTASAAISSTGLIAWTPNLGEEGTYTVTIRAMQAGEVAEQTYTLEVFDPDGNLPPVLDEPTDLFAAPGRYFSFDVPGRDPEGQPVEFFFVDTNNGNLVRSDQGLLISPEGRVQWQVPTEGINNGDTFDFTVDMLDSVGQRTGDPQMYTITIADTPPTVALAASTLRPQVGQTVFFGLMINDDLGRPDVDLTITWDDGSAPQTESPTVRDDGRAEFVIPTGAAGVEFTVTATATDGSNQQDTASLTLRATGLNTTGPKIRIASPTTAIISKATDLEGAIYDQDGNLTFFSVTATPLAGGTPIELLRRDIDDSDTYDPVTDTVDNGGETFLKGIGDLNTDELITELNPFTLAAASYRIDIVARDIEGQTASSFVIGVETDVKLGNLELSFTDMTVPVGGLPISIVRSYDSQQANLSGDFGYGWSLDVITGKAEYLPVGNPANDTVDFIGYDQPIVGGDRIVITLPGGEQHGFTIQPVPVIQGGSRGTSAIQALFDSYALAFIPDGGQLSALDFATTAVNYPQFQYDPDVFEGLIPENVLEVIGFKSVSGEYDVDTGEFFELGAGEGGVPINFSTIGGNLRLQTRDLSVYEFNPESGELLKVTDPYLNTIRFDGRDIVAKNYDDEEVSRITISRENGRIMRVENGLGFGINYGYDSSDDLTSVTEEIDNQAGISRTTTFVYDTNEEFIDPPVGRERVPHYLRQIKDSQGRVIAATDFDETGKLKETRSGDIDNSNGFSQTVSYDLADPNTGKQTVTDAFGNSAEYEFDGDGNVKTITQTTDANGPYGGADVIYRFEHDHRDRLTKQIDPIGRVTTYTYDDAARTVTIVAPHGPNDDPAEFTTVVTQDENGQIEQIAGPFGRTEFRGYNSFGDLTRLSDETGHVFSEWVYDPLGQLTSETSDGSTFTYEYPSQNETRITTSNGDVIDSVFNQIGQLETFEEGDEMNRLYYDGLGRTTSATYNEGDPDEELVVNYDYDLTTSNDQSAGDWTSIDSLSTGRIERRFTPGGQLAGWTLANGGVVAYEYDRGRLDTETDALGRETKYHYDELGRVRKIEDLSTGDFVENTYDLAGRLLESVNSAGEVTEYTYPSETLATVASPRATLGNYYTQTEVEGLTTTTTQAVGTGLERELKTIRNAAGLPTEFINADDSKQIIGYRNSDVLGDAAQFPTFIKDESGRTRYFDYLDDGRLKSSTNLAGVETTFQYDGDLRLETVTLPNGATVTYGYDDQDRLESITRPGLGTYTVTQFNEDSQPEVMQLPSGESVTIVYDDSGRVDSRTSTGGTASESASFTYNDGDAIETIIDNTGTTSYTYYDETSNRQETAPGPSHAGKLERIDYPNGTSVAYTYDTLGRVETLTTQASNTATANTTTYDYDENGNLKTVQAFGDTTDYTYDELDRLATRTLPNGVVTTWTFDVRDRLESIVHEDSSGTVISSFTYDHPTDAIGEPHKITRKDGSYIDLIYDDALRLKSETYYSSGGSQIRSIEYTYDDAGNRTSRKVDTAVETYNIDSESGYELNSITNANPATFTYDPSQGGRLTSVNRASLDASLAYNSNGQLVSVDNASGNDQGYTYDALGRRTAASDGAATYDYLIAPAAQRLGAGALDVEVQHLAKTSTGGVVGWVYAGENPILRYDENGNVEYYLESANDSIAAIIDNATNPTVLAEYEFDGFGNVLNGVNPTSAAGGDFGFHAAWRDDATGLYHMRARSYDPLTGRFLTPDPAEPNPQAPETYEPYSFANNNPHLYSDPTGLFSVAEINVGSAIQSGLNSLKAAAVRQGREFVANEVSEFATELLIKNFTGFLPGGILYNAVSVAKTAQQAGAHFTAGVQGLLCHDSVQDIAQFVRFEVPIDPDSGHPRGNGFGCGHPDVGKPHSGGKGVSRLPNGRNPIRPDWIVGPPEIVDDLEGNQSSKISNKSYLAVEFKLSVTTLLEETKPLTRQLKGIGKYTKAHTTTGKVAVFITALGKNRGSIGAAKVQRAEAIKNLANSGIIGIVLQLTNLTNTFASNR